MGWIGLLLLTVCWATTTDGLLYPAESETRQIRSLDGLWEFRLDKNREGETGKWFHLPALPPPTILMPVPASYNDITQDININRYVGLVWYARDFYIHNTAPRWVLRFQAAHYDTYVWVNGQSAVTHSGGHLPFEADITPFIQTNATYSKVRIVALVNNTLSYSTLPPGLTVSVTPTRQKLQASFDFFNYAGIDRSVILYSTSTAYIEDITIDTQSIAYDDQHRATLATLNYSIITADTNPSNALRVLVELLDANGVVVANNTASEDRLIVNKPNLWEPCGMNHTHPCTEESYLYSLQVTLFNDPSPSSVADIYRIPHVGIRTISLTNSQFIVNGRPFYFHGANAHEDSDMRGKGFDTTILTKHFNLYGWLHGNAFRTSHYPYADEFYQLADRYGLAIIGETPAVGMLYAGCFSNKTLEHHKEVVTEMINRDKNHPSVLMWSLANEPASELKESKDYFRQLVEFTRPIAVSRPITFVSNRNANSDQWVEFIDVICANRYYGWYSSPGDLDSIPGSIQGDMQSWRKAYPTKPIIVSEYGAETLPGLHSNPPLMFTEEYQSDFYTAYHVVFDSLSSIQHPTTGYMIGELVWNMYDFATDQSLQRIGALNHKGLFTRQRQPKAAALVLKNRYERLESVPTPTI